MKHASTYIKLYMLIIMGLFCSVGGGSFLPVGEAHGAVSSKSEAKQKAKERRISNLERKIENYEKKIAEINVKIELHEECRNCCTGNCEKQGVTGACRHWAATEHNGKRIRVCHQLPKGNRRKSGIDQAISSLQEQRARFERSISKIEEKISDIENESD